MCACMCECVYIGMCAYVHVCVCFCSCDQIITMIFQKVLATTSQCLQANDKKHASEATIYVEIRQYIYK